MTLSPLTRVGAYEIQSLIGSGGMGEVYRVRDTPECFFDAVLVILYASHG